MEDCYYEGLTFDELFQREVIQDDEGLLLTDAFLSEVFRPYRIGHKDKAEKI